MRINTNVAAMIGRSNYARAQAEVERALERLATGRRINRGSDDPSGLIAAEGLSSRRISLEETLKGSERARYMLDAAEGGLSQLDGMLIDLSGLVVSAANTGATSQAEREALQMEASSIIHGMSHIVQTTTFNGRQLLAQGGAAEINGSTMWINSIDVQKLGMVSRVEVDENGQETTRTYSLGDLLNGAASLMNGDMELAQEIVEKAKAEITSQRSAIGAHTKYTLGSEARALEVELENTVAAESLIRDAEFAKETSNYIRAEVLRQASAKTIEFAHKQAWAALSLLEGVKPV